jgi:hypothetical protein
MVLWTRWASTGPPRTDPLEGRARAQGGGGGGGGPGHSEERGEGTGEGEGLGEGRHTLVDNNIGPSAI